MNDAAHKMKRGGIPANIDTPPLALSDSSDDQQDATPVTTTTFKLDKNTELATPLSGGRRKMWRRKRRQSNSKDEKCKESSFLEKVQNSDRLARRQSLPPLLTLQLSQECEHNASTSTLLDEATLPDGASRDSTPRPKQPDTPLTPNGSFSPEVSELIESVKHPLRHRRNGSNGSIRVHRRQGSNGSVSSSIKEAMPLRNKEATPLRTKEATPLRNSNPSTATSSKRASVEIMHSASRRGSGSSIPYSRMDGTESESNSEEHESTGGLRVSFPSQSGVNERGVSSGHAPSDQLREVCSNESSMDTHESDGAGNEADGESTSDGYENRLDGFSGTEPHETTESNFESSTASPSQAESEDLNTRVSGMESNLPTSLILDPFPLMTSSPISGGRGQSHDQLLWDSSLSNCYSSSHGNHQVATLVSQFEQLPAEDSEATSETNDLLNIPVHIRRQQSPESRDNTNADPTTPTSGRRLGSMTAIVRTFFENMSSKPRRVGLHNQDSGEFEDSGFQVCCYIWKLL